MLAAALHPGAAALPGASQAGFSWAKVWAEAAAIVIAILAIVHGDLPARHHLAARWSGMKVTEFLHRLRPTNLVLPPR